MVILGLGSNIGDRLTHLNNAISRLKTFIKDIKLSSIYSSDALTPDLSPASWNKEFLNMAIAGKTNMSAQEVLKSIKQIELDLGRDNSSEKWSPRIIDIDILAYDQIIINEKNIKIPHPHLLKRPFALWCLAEICPKWVHPINNKTSFELAQCFGTKFPDDISSKGNHFNTVRTSLRLKND